MGDSNRHTSRMLALQLALIHGDTLEQRDWVPHSITSREEGEGAVKATSQAY